MYKLAVFAVGTQVHRSRVDGVQHDEEGRVEAALQGQEVLPDRPAPEEDARDPPLAVGCAEEREDFQVRVCAIYCGCITQSAL